MPGSGLDVMIDSDKRDSLSRLYRLFAMVPTGLLTLRKALRDSIIRRGKELAASSAGGNVDAEEDDEAEDDEVFDAEGFDFSVPFDVVLPDSTGLNDSQMQAIASWTAPLSLIWGPPGKFLLECSWWCCLVC